MSTGARARRRNAYIALACWAALVVVGLPLRTCAPDKGTEGVPTEIPRLRQRIATLEEENAALRQRVSVLASVDQPLSGFRPVPALLFPYLDLSGDRSSAVVDVGEEQGVRPGYGVICDAGVVGRVAEVWTHQSRVALADDPSFRAHFRRQGDQAEGIVIGGVGTGVVCPAYLRERTVFEAGDVLVTAGELVPSGGYAAFPRGVVIGVVESARAAAEDVRVRLPVAWRELRAVVVLVPPGEQ